MNDEALRAMTRYTNDDALRAMKDEGALAGRRGRAFTEAMADSCFTEARADS